MTMQKSGSQRSLVPSSYPSAGKAYFDTMRSRFAARLGWRGLILLLVAAVAAGVFLDWKWLVAVGAAPLVLAVLPCAAMCAVGLCAMGGNKESGTKPQDTSGSTLTPQDQSTEPLPTRPRD